jgi:hypothetical protein
MEYLAKVLAENSPVMVLIAFVYWGLAQSATKYREKLWQAINKIDRRLLKLETRLNIEDEEHE